MSAGLRGTGMVADDLYLMAHNEANGRPFLQPRALGTGLAGGLLAELMLAGGITLGHDGTLFTGSGFTGRVVLGDGLARQVLGMLAAEQPLPVREWLLFLARTAAEDVARRLELSGYVRRAGGRVPWLPVRWVPVDADWAFAPLLRVRSALDPARPWSAYGAVLAGLADACGLGFRLAQYATQADRSAEQAARRLPGGLRELIAHTQATVGSALLCHRK
jgi:hypothetical protein